MPTDNSLSSFTHCKVPGGTKEDLSIKATRTQMYVCRVNDILREYVFSDWVKVKVLDIGKAGMLCYFSSVHESDVIIANECALCFCQSCGIASFETNAFCSLSSSGLPLDWQGEPHIAINPKPQTIQKGEKFTLRCAAFGIPAPHYQWYRNGQQLPTGSVDTLQVCAVSYKVHFLFCLSSFSMTVLI